MHKEKINSSIVCGACGEVNDISMEVDLMGFAPKNRSRIMPVGVKFPYRITSKDIENFLIETSRVFVKDVKVEVVPIYCEKKKKKSFEPHRSYASLRIAFSHQIIENYEDFGWYGKIGASSDNIKYVNSEMKNLVERYKFNADKVKEWLKDYKVLDNLEEAFGMDEKYILDIKEYIYPKLIKAKNGSVWIAFSAAIEPIIYDMLADKDTKKVDGTIKIEDIYRISNDIIEFSVIQDPYLKEYEENSHVRQIIAGEEKAKIK